MSCGFEYLCRIYKNGERVLAFEPIVVRAWTRGGAASKAFEVTDPDLDAPDGAEVDGYRCVGRQWEPIR